MIHRRVLSALALVAGVLLTPVAAAQDFPKKPLRLMVPFAAGGAADIIGRSIADKLGQLYGQTVVVENVSGAGSNNGIATALKAEPDGHTLILGAVALAVNPTLYKAMPYDPLTDLAPLTLALETPNVVIVPAQSRIKTMQDLAAAAKAGPLSYGSAGVGSSLHLAAELFKQQAGIEMTHVPYRGSSPALADLMAGRIDVMFDNASTALPQVQGGTARAIAVTTKSRIAAVDAPTVAESGFPGYEMSNWWAFFASSRTSPAIVAKLSTDLRKVLADPAVKRRFDEIGGIVVASSADDLRAHLAEESRKWRGVVETAGIRSSQ